MSAVSIMYIGRRVFDKDKGQIAFAFLVGDEIRFWLSVKKWLRIGYMYEGEKKDDGTIGLPKVPNELCSANIPDDEIQTYIIEDEKALAFQKRVRATRQAKTRAEKLYSECYELRNICKNMSFREISIFASELTEVIYSENKKKGKK